MDKYWAIRNVTEKYFPGNKMPVPQDSKKLGGIPVKMRQTGLLVDQIGPGELKCLLLNIKQSRCNLPMSDPFSNLQAEITTDGKDVPIK